MQFFKNLFSKTYTTTLTVTSSNGFHLRPIAQFVAKAKVVKSPLTASFKDKTVNAKAVNTLLTLNLDKGDTFTLSVKAKNGKKILSGLKHTFELLMDDDQEVTSISKKSHGYEGEILEGDALYEGVAIAPLHLYTCEESYSENSTTFDEAIQKSVEELESLYQTHASNDDASIYLAQKELLLSHAEEIDSLEALQTVIDEMSLTLKEGKHASKISDYEDLLRRVKSHLGYSYTLTYPKTPFILLAEDLLPSEIQLLQKSNVQGIILKNTSSTSHTAILLRSTGITSMIVTHNVPLIKEDVILDTNASVLVLFPSDKDIKVSKEIQRIEGHQKAKSHARRFHQAFTTSEQHIQVLANVSDVDSAVLAKEEGAEGVGLLRTEFLFGHIKPTLKDQTDAYKSIFSLFSNVTVRTLDVGGDKALPYVQIPLEENPFLGVRGIRLFRTHPEILEEQLHAIFLAAKNRSVKIMFPMVSSVEEFTKAKSFAQNVALKHDLDISNILFGIMIEVPSVLFLIEAFNEVVDFYSVGTNDLTQYLFATERTHPLLKTDELSPVVFSALEMIIHKSTKPVSLCGELAASKKAIPKLIDLGIHTLSVTPKSISNVKDTIRNV